MHFFEVILLDTDMSKKNSGVYMTTSAIYVGNFEKLSLEKNKWRYKGDYKIEAKLGGYGIYFDHEQIYHGHFSYGVFSENGTLKYNTRLEYQGRWQSGWLRGRGSITYPDGLKLEGKW
jgi:hypothetical protein